MKALAGSMQVSLELYLCDSLTTLYHNVAV